MAGWLVEAEVGSVDFLIGLDFNVMMVQRPGTWFASFEKKSVLGGTEETTFCGNEKLFMADLVMVELSRE